MLFLAIIFVAIVGLFSAWLLFIGIQDRDGFLIICGIAAAAMTVGIAYAAYQDQTSDQFALSKERWACTATTEATHFVMIGKTLMPQTHTVCVQYTAN